MGVGNRESLESQKIRSVGDAGKGKAQTMTRFQCDKGHQFLHAAKLTIAPVPQEQLPQTELAGLLAQGYVIKNRYAKQYVLEKCKLAEAKTE